MDSQSAVDLICKGSESAHANAPLVYSIRQLLARDWTVKIHHNYREAHFCADWLANYALSLELGVTFLPNPPPGIFSVLLSDISGVSMPRMCVL